MTEELQTQRDILAERQAEEFVHIHTLSNLYAKQSFIEGFDACHSLMSKDIEALQSKLDVAKKALKFIEKLHEDDIVLTSTEYNHKSAVTYRKTIESLKEME